jgi:rhodanese-related sulfurtransferase
MAVQNICAKEAFSNLLKKENSILIDVRTNEEVNFVGFPDLSSIARNVIFVPWRLLPNMSINDNFEFNLVDEIKKITDDKESKINLLFLCRSGARSMEAALFMSDICYNCYNIEKGFEGDLDQNGQRSNLNGWKFENNPWKQK